MSIEVTPYPVKIDNVLCIEFISATKKSKKEYMLITDFIKNLKSKAEIKRYSKEITPSLIDIREKDKKNWRKI